MKSERKPRTKYSNRCETLRITDSEEKNDSSNDEPATPKYSLYNLESRKKRKRNGQKSIKITIAVKHYIKIIKAKTKKDTRNQLLLLLTKLNN